MKFLILSVCIAIAAAEIHWDESGQYRLVDDKPIEIKYEIEGGLPANYQYLSYPLPYPESPLRYPGTPLPYPGTPLPYPGTPLPYPGYPYPYPMPLADARVALKLKEQAPFIFDYKLVKSEEEK